MKVRCKHLQTVVCDIYYSRHDFSVTIELEAAFLIPFYFPPYRDHLGPYLMGERAGVVVGKM